MKTPDSEKRCLYLASAFLLLLAVIFFLPVIFQGKVFYGFDMLYQYLPWSSYIREDFRSQNSLISDPVIFFYPIYYFYKSALGNAEWPLWNALNFCGLPFVPFGFYPLFFYTLFPLFTAHHLLLFLHLAGTGIFTYIYLREIRLDFLPSLIGAVSWMFNGYVMVWFEFEYTLIMAFTLPGILCFIERLFRKKTMFSFLGLVFMFSISVCTGYAHLLIYQCVLIGIYIVYRCFLEKKSNAGADKPFISLLMPAIAGIIASLIISTNFLTTHLTLYQGSQRKPIAYQELFKEKGALPVKYLSTLLFPDLFGNPGLKVCFTPRTQEPQAYNNYNELCIYTGIFSVFLASACLPSFGRKRYVSFFITTAVLTLLMAMGTILYYPLARFVPGLGLSTPTRILYLFGFSVSILAAFGAEIIRNGKSLSKLPVTFLWILILITAVGIVFFVQTEDGITWAVGSDRWKQESSVNDIRVHFAMSSPAILSPILIIFATFIVLISMLHSPEKYKIFILSLGLLLFSSDLISFAHFYNTASLREMGFPKTPGIRFLQKDQSKFRIMTFGNFFHNSFALFGIEDIGGYSSFYPRRYGEFLHLSQKGPGVPFPGQFSRWITFDKFGSPLLDLVNTKYVLVPPSTEFKSERLRLVYKGEINIYENLSAFPRIFFVPKYHLVNSEQEAYHALGKCSREDFLHTVILESPPPDGFTADGNDSGEEPKIKLTAYTPNRIESEIESNINGFMVIGDNYHSGWEATVDGKQTDILRANYIMRAIPVTKGKHTVILAFRPKLLIAGMLITAAGWMILFTAIAVCLIRRKQTDRC